MPLCENVDLTRKQEISSKRQLLEGKLYWGQTQGLTNASQVHYQ